MNTKQWPTPSAKDKDRIYRRLVSDGDCLLWPGWTVNGYAIAGWLGIRWRLHRLVLIWADEGLERTDLMIRHSCRKKHCVAIAHLSWGTSKENYADAVRDGAVVLGANRSQSKLNEAKVLNIWSEYYENHQPMSAIAERYGCSKGLVQRVLDRRAWPQVTYTLPDVKLDHRKIQRKRGKLSEDFVRDIWRLYHVDLLPYTRIAPIFSVSVSTVQRIIERRLFKDVTKNLRRAGPSRHIRKIRKSRVRLVDDLAPPV